MISLRASSLPRLVRCPGSHNVTLWEAPEDRKRTEPRRLGSAMHEVLASLSVPDFDEIASRFDVPKAKLLECWEKFAAVRAEIGELPESVRAYFEVGMEMEIERCRGYSPRRDPVNLTGHADLVLFDEARNHAVVYDWKTGRGEVDPAESNAQLAAYALLAMHEFGASVVTVNVHQLATGWTTGAMHTQREELEGLIRSIADAVEVGTLRAGLHCRHCPAVAGCEMAAKAMAPATRQDIHDVIKNFGSMSPAKQGELVIAAKIAEKAAEAVLSAAKAHILKTGCPIPVGDNEEMVRQVSRRRSIVITPESWRTLTEICGDRLGEAVEVSQGKVVNIAKDRRLEEHKAEHGVSSVPYVGWLSETERNVKAALAPFIHETEFHSFPVRQKR